MLQFLNKNNQWIDLEKLTIYRGDTPTINYEFNLNEETNRLEITILEEEDIKVLKPNTIIRFKENTAKDFTYWIVGDYSKDKKITCNIHLIKLLEPIEITKGIRVEPISFYPRRYTFKQVIDRIKFISKFDFIFNETLLNLSKDWCNPRFNFNGTTLYNILFEIGRCIDRCPEFVYNLMSNKWELKFIRMDGIGSKEHPMSIFNGRTHKEEYVNDGLTNAVYSEVKNLVGNIENVYPNDGFGIRAEPFDENESTLTSSNAVFRLSENIRDIVELRIWSYIAPTDSKPQGTDRYYISINKENNFIGKYAYIDTIETLRIKEIKLIEKLEYDKLPDKKGYIPYEAGTNLIDLRNFKWDDQASVRYAHWDENVPVTYDASGHITNLEKCYFSVKYIPIGSADIPLAESNYFDIERTVFYNQNETLVDADKIADNLKNYVFNMSGSDLLKNGTFNNWDDIPRVGENVIGDDRKRYVISKVSITTKNSCFDCYFQLNENHTRRSEYIGADTSFMLYDIPNNEILDRLTLERDIIKFSLNEQIINQETSRMTSPGEISFLNTLVGDFENPKGTPNCFVSEFYNMSELGHTKEYLQYVFDSMTIIPAGTNILFNIKASDNRIYRSSIDKMNQRLFTYTDPRGECKHINIRICKFPFSSENEELKTIMKNFPISQLEINNNISSLYQMVLFPNYYYDKDAFERFNFTYQISYKGVNDTIIRNDFVKDTASFNDSNTELAISFYDYNLGEYDDISNFINSRNISFSSFKENINSKEKYLEFDLSSEYTDNFRSLCIYNKKTNKPYIIKNYYSSSKLQGTKLRLYVSFERG